MKEFISTKRFTGFPCTHRAWMADSHCRFVHGYSREFYFEFACNELSQEQWVVDFGGLKEVKKWLNHMFDHTFLIASDDPYLPQFEQMDKDGVIQLRVMPSPGMEATAKFVYDHVNKIVAELTSNRAWVTKVEVRENEKNSAWYIAPITLS